VRDSKTLSDSNIAEMSQRIQELCPNMVLVWMPDEYNRMYGEHGHNLNELLAYGHATIIAKMSSQFQIEHSLSDQFAEPSVLNKELEKLNCTTPIEQRTKAESDMAVAAASILARAAFVSAMQELSNDAGIDLPRGASSPDIPKVISALMQKGGRGVLQKYAKMHFKTVTVIANH
jgi:ribonuclease HIII